MVRVLVLKLGDGSKVEESLWTFWKGKGRAGRKMFSSMGDANMGRTIRKSLGHSKNRFILVHRKFGREQGKVATLNVHHGFKAPQRVIIYLRG